MNDETAETAETESDGTETVELTTGKTVAVRGLTGMEVALIGKRNAQLGDNPDEPGGIAIQIGIMLGHAKIRDAEAAGTAWLRAANAVDFTRVTGAIERMSGYGQGAQKRAVD
jgi:hypothetical protein